MAAESDGEPPDHIRQQIASIVDDRIQENRREQVKAFVGRAMNVGLSRRQAMRIAGVAFGMGAASSVGFYWGSEEARAAATGEDGTAAEPLLKVYTAEILGGGVPIKVSDHLDLQSSQEIQNAAKVSTEELLTSKVSKTISSGTVSYDSAYLELSGEGGSADTLTNVTGGSIGDILILASSGDSITVSHGNTPGFRLDGSSDKSLDNVIDKLMLIKRISDVWDQIAFSTN